MADITLKKINSATMFVSGSPQALVDLESYFKTPAPNFRFHPKYKAGFWDGMIRHFSPESQHLPIGLLQEVNKFCVKGRYTLDKDFDQSHKITPEFFNKFIEHLKIRIKDKDGNVIPDAKPRDYQLASVWDALTKMHVNIEVPTSGGKTLISYIIARYMAARGKRMLLVVPTTTLVEQTYGDWFDYGWDTVRDNVHRVYGGQEKYFGCNVTISTWQSIYTKPEIFENFDCLMIDEGHGAKATSLRNIATWCCNAEWRIGMSGTYPSESKKEERGDYLNIVGGLGPIRTYTSYQEMEEKGWIPKIELCAILLKHKLERRREIAKIILPLKKLRRENLPCEDPYSTEINYIHNLPERNEFIAKLIENSCKGNTMVLFTKVDAHGLPLKEFLESYFTGKRKVVYIDGSIDVLQRNAARMMAEKADDLILLASYGTFSTGISIKNLHNVIFASGYKSKYKILQSIGRGLRAMVGKVKVKIFDLVDDCSIQMKDEPMYENYSMKHFKDRQEIYGEKGLTWKSIKYEF